MRTPRVFILVLFFTASLFLFCRSISSGRRIGSAGPFPPTDSSRSSSGQPAKSPFRAFFTFSAPFNLFPPNAAISLTDDNSTSFPARPAAFGPPLPAKGLSGQLWIGSGFADDEGEGELGCSDVPGLHDGRTPHLAFKANSHTLESGAPAKAAARAKHAKKRDLLRGPPKDLVTAAASDSSIASVNDGTDDYLHQGLQLSKRRTYESTLGSGSTHADIQSIQEAAEITGKVVLLSRGGCGFLEKVKWAQRRGATAVIVGDNQRGGPLIQMFARGNVDNVSIPSIFTSRTTAHLLSSLMQPGSFIEDILMEKTGSQADRAWTSKAKAATAHASGSKSAIDAINAQGAATSTDRPGRTRPGWFSRLLHWGAGRNAASDGNRLASSEDWAWVVVDEWTDEKHKVIKNSLDKAARKAGADAPAAANGHPVPIDDFKIGIEDWRDPDLVGARRQESTKDTWTSSDSAKTQAQARKTAMKQDGKKPKVWTDNGAGPTGGSITPSSGEYAAQVAADRAKKTADQSSSSSSDDGGDVRAKSDAPTRPASPPAAGANRPPTRSKSPHHDGLWVTITPTGSASPFFDTLLVLVVSPLITLTVVYALLVLRAKIRRRRWRAPKSVVEQLPVRTYHTVATTPGHSPRNPSPTNSSPTTPLLQQGGGVGSSHAARPRSRTTTGVPESSSALQVDTTLAPSRSSSRSSREKTNNQVSSEWKKYMGRQVECVVCLEEYVDGVSRVMSLPCGHEFHAECITPWLTTRRRTCPICKGDVVRSLARGSSSSPRYEPYQDDSDDEYDATASSSRQPRPDLEHGIVSPVPRRGLMRPPDLTQGYFSTLGNALGVGSSSSYRSSRRVGSEHEEHRGRESSRSPPPL